MKILLSSLFLLTLLQATYAAELFGIQLQNSTLDQLRAAVKKAGATVIEESDGTRPYDTFDSKALFPGSSKLYIGYLEEGRKTAFVEYEFVGLNRPALLRLLSAKYGKPALLQAKYLSDRGYRWKVESTSITLWSDWSNYRTRISYIVPERLRTLTGSTGALAAQGEMVDVANY